MKKVLVAVPNLQEINTYVARGLIKLSHDKRYETDIVMPIYDPPVENNRSHIINHFLKGDWDYLLSMDSDNPPTADPLDLVELDLDLVGLPTPIWRYKTYEPGAYPMDWNVYDEADEPDHYIQHFPHLGLQECDAIGSGAFLVARRVLEHPLVRFQPFQRKYNDDGTVKLGGDMAFCQKVKQAGFKVHAHFGYICLHYKQVELTAIMEAYAKYYKARQKPVKQNERVQVSTVPA